MTHRKWLLLMLGGVAIVILLSPGLQKQPLDFIGVPMTSVMARLQQGLSAVTDGVAGMWNGYLALVNTRQENERMMLELERLRQENLRLQEQAMENSRLQHLLDFKRASTLRLTAASVIGRDPTNWYKTIMLNKGERDGLRVNMGVITPAGVVGRIIRTTPVSSQVLLLTDRNSSSAALIQRTRDGGLVEGIEGVTLRMKYLPILSEIEVGDVVLTSGLAGIFPKGLLIGHVSEVDKKEDQLFQVVLIKPFVDFTKLEEVLVIVTP